MSPTLFLRRPKMIHLPLFLRALFLTLAISSSGIQGESNITANVTTENDNQVITKFGKKVAALSEDEVTLEKWKKLEEIIANFSSQAVGNIVPYILRFSKETKISFKCSRSIMQVIYGIKHMETWAFRMIDASGKIPNGVLHGYFASLGDFDGCLSVDAPGHNPFQGQYCSVFLKPPIPKQPLFHNTAEVLPLFVNFTKKGTLMEELSVASAFFNQLLPRTSVCVPSTCSREEIQKMVDTVIISTGFPWNVSVPSCEVTEPLHFSKSDTAIICVLSIIGLLAFIGTVTDVILNLISKEKRLKMEKSSIAVKCLMCFSTYTNTLRLLKKDTSPDSIKIFHGMKVVTVLWVMLNHTYYYTNFSLCGGLTNARDFGKQIAFQFALNGFLNVETFFFISSVLLAYGRMKFTGRNISIALYIFRRLWRLTPSLMLVIATSMLVPHMGSGPGWKETVGPLIDRCKANWWANLLYFNNFLSWEDMCFEWLWYIPVDFHLYLLALFVIVPLKTRPKLALGINAMIFIAGTLASAASHIYYKQVPTAIYVYSDKQDIRHYTENSYYRSYTHITTCCIGLYVGYIMATRPKLKIPLILNIFGWLSSVIFALLVLYGVHDWNQGNVPGLAVSTLYMCTNKVVWALALGYVTIACYTGNGGIITSVLSWSAFVPLSRLTYVVYLVHPILLFMYVGSTRVLLQFEHKTIVYRYLGNTFMSYIIAYVVSLLFESPFMCLEKVMFSRKTSSKASSEPNPEHNDKFGQPLKCAESAKHNDRFGEQLKCADSAVSTINIKKIETDGP